MRHKPICVSKLAAESGIDPDETLIRLMDAGLDYRKPTDMISRRDVPAARAAIGLGLPDHHSPTVAELAATAGLEEPLAREILVSCGILSKRRLRRPPRHLVQAALDRLKEKAVPERAPKEKKTRAKKKKDFLVLESWPTVGRTERLDHLSARDIVDIHWILVENFAKSRDPVEPPGVRDRNLLESAVFRLRTAMGGRDKYPTVSMAGAALLHALIHNHPFHNGNKRTALVALLALLDKNGWVLVLDEDEIYDYLLSVASHRLLDKTTSRPLRTADEEMLSIAYWLQRHIRQVRKDERPLRFRELRDILTSYGCSFEKPKRVGNRMNISRGELRTQIGYTNDGGELQVNAIHKVRRDLELDEEHGYDSDIFYDKGKRIPEFIIKHRKVLERLAKA